LSIRRHGRWIRSEQVFDLFTGKSRGKVVFYPFQNGGTHEPGFFAGAETAVALQRGHHLLMDENPAAQGNFISVSLTVGKHKEGKFRDRRGRCGTARFFLFTATGTGGKQEQRNQQPEDSPPYVKPQGTSPGRKKKRSEEHQPPWGKGAAGP